MGSTTLDLAIEGRRVSRAIEKVKTEMYVGETVVVLRPMVLMSGVVNFKEVKAKVLQKYDDWFLVEDLIGEGYNKYKRRWGVRYADLVCNRWHQRLRYCNV